MAYEGWLEYDGVEIVNLSRTAQLAQTLNISTVWLRASDLAWIQDDLEGVDYFDPTTSPWYDPDYPASVEFAGIIPLSVAGLDDSTLESTPIEYITDGGNSGRPRHTTLPIVSNVVLVGSTERGVEYGLRWMNKMLRQNSNARIVCSGAPLRYFKHGSPNSPIVHRRDVSLTRGSSVTRKRSNHCSSTWTATFTLTAADPFEYGEEHPVIEGLGGPGVLARENLVPNPSFEVDASQWGTGAGVSLTSAGDSVLNVVGSQAGLITTTTAVSAGQGIVWTDLIPVTPGGVVSLSGRVRRRSTGAGSESLLFQVRFYDAANQGVPGAASVVVSALSGSPSSLNIGVLEEVPVPSNAAKARVFWSADQPLDVDQLFSIDAHLLVEGPNTDVTYFDGDTPDNQTYRYEWTGTPGVSTSQEVRRAGIPGFGEGPFGLGLFGGGAVLSTGELLLIQQSCPAYDYTPIYDPLYPALVPSPTAPNFYPDGWSIESGMEFQRYWARVEPLEPSYLDVVPLFTLRSDEEARNVRVSVWPSDYDTDAQCDPLFSAVITYLPAGVNFYIDGEQKAAYVWDGSSPVVRRTDSLVYSPDAGPVDWTQFNDPSNLLVTLDLFETGSGYAGEGTLTMDLALIPKTD